VGSNGRNPDGDGVQPQGKGCSHPRTAANVERTAENDILFKAKLVDFVTDRRK
jgi:hypothetical protein